MRKISALVLFLSVITTFYSCQKEVSQYNQEKQPKSESANSNITSTNPGLSYGDTLFFLKNQPGDYTILPISKPAVTGYFKVIPLGLVLDSLTGQINVTQSETGLRYKVFYLDASGQPVDSLKLVISGIDYTDSIYQIQTTTSAYDTAFPIYNARPEIQLPCNEDDDDEDFACTFDETDLNGDGNDDIPGVNQDKLLVNTKTGIIDVEASFHAGVFASNPANGATKDFTFYYRIYDASNRALNKITVRLYRFYSVNDIPQWLLDELNRRKNLSNSVNSSSPATNNAVGFEAFKAAPRRPPIIIIVSS
jgi:hypothetical protein